MLRLNKILHVKVATLLTSYDWWRSAELTACKAKLK